MNFDQRITTINGRLLGSLLLLVLWFMFIMFILLLLLSVVVVAVFFVHSCYIPPHLKHSLCMSNIIVPALSQTNQRMILLVLAISL